MKRGCMVLALGVLTGSVQAATITYDFTASGGYTGVFVYNDTATPYATEQVGGGTAAFYDAISYSVNGLNYSNPVLAIFHDDGGQDSALFETTSNSPALELNAPEGLFSSTSANVMDGRTLSNFPSNSYFAPSLGGATYGVISLTEVSAVPLPAAAWLLLSGLGGLGLLGRKRAV